MKIERKEWKISVWTGNSTIPEPMTEKEIETAITYLRKHNYPKPSDCQMQDCQGYRPACMLGICYVAVRLCGDF